MPAPTNYYVDPAINANTGTGTIGDPFGDLQYALNTVTRNTTAGDQFNVKTGTAEVLTAPLSLTTYGVPTYFAQLVIRGYTAAANDGGRATINGGGNAIMTTAMSHTKWIDLNVSNVGAYAWAPPGTNNNTAFIRCDITATTGPWAGLHTPLLAYGCYIHDCQYGLIVASFSEYVFDSCYIKNCSVRGTSLYRSDGRIRNCIFNCGAGITAIYFDAPGESGYHYEAIGNTIYGAGGAGKGIEVRDLIISDVAIVNNLITHFSGVGGYGVLTSSGTPVSVFAGNHFYNNANHYSLNHNFGDMGSVILGASPYVGDPAAGDFRVNGTVKAGAWPTAFLGSITNQYLDPGAAQRQEAGGGSIFGGIFS